MFVSSIDLFVYVRYNTAINKRKENKKMKRFIKEFASYQIKSLKACDLMQPDIKAEKIRRIKEVVKAESLGLLTVAETMDAIARA